MKLCKDCRHSRCHSQNVLGIYAKCDRTKVVDVCPVTGYETTVKIDYCRDERLPRGWFGQGCGPDARYFEPREDGKESEQDRCERLVRAATAVVETVGLNNRTAHTDELHSVLQEFRK